MTAGAIREEPTIPAMDNPVNIKAPKRRIGIQTKALTSA
jgi:hypothetical protein